MRIGEGSASPQHGPRRGMMNFLKSDDGGTLLSIALMCLAQHRKAKVAKKSGAICGPGDFVEAQTLLDGRLLDVQCDVVKNE
jgi:hypothetical protein